MIARHIRVPFYLLTKRAPLPAAFLTAVLLAALLFGGSALADDPAQANPGTAATPAASDEPTPEAETAAEPEVESKGGQDEQPVADPLDGKLVIGARAELTEAASGLTYVARIDTGATTCSIHAENVRVEDAKKDMRKNVGKEVVFTLVNTEGDRKEVESTIIDTVRVKTSEEKERRYKVWLTLRYGDVERRVHVTLNDRSHMSHPLLIGRNFLKGKFLVDVERELTRAKSSESANAAKTASR